MLEVITIEECNHGNLKTKIDELITNDWAFKTEAMIGAHRLSRANGLDFYAIVEVELED